MAGRWVRAGVMLWLCTVLAAFGVRAFARPFPAGAGGAPSLVTLSAARGCTLPCLFGVLPGTAPAGESLRALDAYRNPDDDASLVTQASRPGYLFTAYDPAGVLQFGFMGIDIPPRFPAAEPALADADSAADAPVLTMRVSPIRGTASGIVSIASVGELLATLGPPITAVVGCENMQPRQIALVFGIGPGVRAEVWARRPHITPETPVLALTTYSADGFAREAGSMPFSCYTTHPWRGFAPLWAYEQAGR